MKDGIEGQSAEEAKPFAEHARSVRDIYERAAEASRTPSRVIDSAGLADSIQQGVGGKDVQRDMLKQLTDANDTLKKILIQRGELVIGRMGP